MVPTAIAVHGGCGVMAKLALSEAEWAAAREDLARALRAGWACIAGGKSAVDRRWCIEVEEAARPDR